MKFAKELEQDLVPEWRAKYLDYKAGKKKVKAVARAVARANATPKSSRLNPRDHYRGTGSPYLPKKSSTFAVRRPANGIGNAVFDSLREEPGAESQQTSDESDQVRKPILISKHKSKIPESPRMQYGSFVPTPPSEFNPEQLELPGPALKPGQEPPSPEIIFGRNTLPGRSKPNGMSMTPPAGAPNTYDAFTVGRRSPAPQRTSVGNLFGIGSPMMRRVSTANVPTPREPAPLLRRLLSHTGALPLDQPDVNLVPLDHVRAKEREFFEWMDGQLEKVETFYKQKEDEAGERLHVLREQLHEMRNRRIEEIAHTKRSRETGPGDDNLSGVEDTSNFPIHPSSSDRANGSSTISRDHHIWTKPVEKALGPFKIGPRPGANSNHLIDMQKSPNLRAAERMKEIPGMDPARDYVRKPHEHEVPYRSAKRKLKIALKEYYRSLELLKSYALMNRTAFRKINKKYDKAANAHPPLRYMSDKVNKSWFVQSDVLDGYLHAVEDLYARYFERGNHKVAIGKLRSTDGKPGQHTASVFRSGLLIGTGAVFGIQGLINAAQMLHDHPDPTIKIRTSYLLQIYGGYFLALYLFAFFCIDCSVWVANKINYVFIFEFDPRNHLDWRQLAEFPAFLTLLLGLFMWINFSGLGTPEMFLYYPVLLIFVTLVIIFLPVPILFHRSRGWFAYAHWRLLLAGIYPVEFRDFFLGDIWCSLTYVTANIELFFCLYAHHWSDPVQCNSNNSRLLGFFTALPGIWRALQCLRRYNDTHSAFPHLANFGKYTTTILYYVTLSIYRIHKSHALLAVFIAFATLNSIYSSFWDLFMDWSLLQPTSSASSSGAGGSEKSGKSWPGLRPLLSYSSPYYYYCAMVIDVLLRFNWIFYAIFTHDLQHSTIVSFLISFSEANRRGMWTLFRVENEHAANVMRFKASRDVPLPYKLRSADYQRRVEGSLVHPEGAEEEEEEVAVEAVGAGTGVERERYAETVRRVPSRPSPMMAEEELPVAGMRRRKTLTRIFADAHTQDFEKKRKPDGAGSVRGGLGGAAEERESSGEQNSSDEDASDSNSAVGENGEELDEPGSVLTREGRHVSDQPNVDEADGRK